MHYNDQGLLDQWHETHPWYDNDQLSTFEYDNHKRVSKMKFYDHNNFLYTVKPVYKSGRITEELWYVGDTYTLDDKVVNTYNSKGQIVKRESLNYDYYATFKYDAIGNTTQSDVLGTDGTLFVSETLSYDKPVREPMVAVPGLPYPIPYINYTISKLKYTYYKQVYPDADGNLVTGYEHDSDKSIPLKAGPEGFAVYYNTFDKVSQLYNRQIWDYQNCDCDKEDEVQRFTQPALNISPSPGKNQRPHFITMPEMREKIKQIRNQNRR